MIHGAGMISFNIKCNAMQNSCVLGKIEYQLNWTLLRFCVALFCLRVHSWEPHTPKCSSPTHPPFLFFFFFVKMILSKFNTDALMVLVDMSGHSGWLPLLLQTCSGKWCRRMKGCFIMKSSSLTSSFSLGGILFFFLFQADEFEL